ncbi:hypothetical protein JHK87_009769 [Glycine soja]|nr:hypothetical protein JHK87_009769 [Glycine soja]
MNGDTHLQLGQVYFMLPYSVLHADVSPVDLAGLAERLTAIAKSGPLSSQTQTFWNSPSRSLGRVGVVEQYGVGKRRVKDLLLQKDNRFCADCNAPDPKRA